MRWLFRGAGQFQQTLTNISASVHISAQLQILLFLFPFSSLSLVHLLSLSPYAVLLFPSLSPFQVFLSHHLSSKYRSLTLLTSHFNQIAPPFPLAKLCYIVHTWNATDSLARAHFCKEQPNKGDPKPTKEPCFQKGTTESKVKLEFLKQAGRVSAKS